MTETTDKTPESAMIKALAAAQAEMSNVGYDKTNPHFKNKYSSLAAVRNAVLPALNKHGIAMVQYTKLLGDKMVLHTRLMHEDGGHLESDYPISLEGSDQNVGSRMTYARRYSLSSLCGVSADDDDDGNAASGKDPQQQAIAQIAEKAAKKAETATKREEMAEATGQPKMTKTSLQAAVRAIVTAIGHCEDEDSLEAFLANEIDWKISGVEQRAPVKKIRFAAEQHLDPEWIDQINEAEDLKRDSFSLVM